MRTEVSGRSVKRAICMSKAYEDLARLEETRQFYAMTEEALSPLPDNEYGRKLRDAAQRALKRVWPLPAETAGEAIHLQK